MTLKTTYGPKNLRHTGLGPYVGARMVGPVCRTPNKKMGLDNQLYPKNNIRFNKNK
jgi:hypothetical protein